MKFTKVTNPIEEEITVNYRGENYVIGPKETKQFDTELAQHWVRIYDFMELKEVDDKEVIDEKIKEAKEEKPKAAKKVAKKKTK